MNGKMGKNVDQGLPRPARAGLRSGSMSLTTPSPEVAFHSYGCPMTTSFIVVLFTQTSLTGSSRRSPACTTSVMFVFDVLRILWFTVDHETDVVCKEIHVAEGSKECLDLVVVTSYMSSGTICQNRESALRRHVSCHGRIQDTEVCTTVNATAVDS